MKLAAGVHTSKISLLYLQPQYERLKTEWTDTAHIDCTEPVEFHMLTCLIKARTISAECSERNVTEVRRLWSDVSL